MQKSLFNKYFSICSAIIIVSITILGVVLLLFASQYFSADKYSLLKRNAKQAVALTQISYEMFDYQYIETGSILSAYNILGGAIDADIFLVDTNGKTLLCTHKTECNHSRMNVSQDVLRRVQRGDFKETGRLSDIYDDLHYTVGIPILNGDNITSGVVFVSSAADDLNDFLIEILKMFGLSAVTVLCLSFIVIYFATNGLVRPLRNMVAATQSFAKGDFSIRVPVEGHDEVGQLAMAFNNMASSLSSLELMRRSFVANVSHELKTPMTTIAGFIDGIMDGTIPEEKRNQYLKIVSGEVKRLSRLVRSMLNIAKIEAGETKISPTVFDINDITCRTIFTFEQSIESKHLDIRGLDSGKIMVEADMDLVHQVVYNLIENAVKFVDDNGYIEFNYLIIGQRVQICIRNSGAGISSEEISKVFDRFYKSDKSRSLDKNGVGLGLYIVRTIINLHEGDIFVRSAQGEYCEFVFTLPLPKNTSSLFKKKSNMIEGKKSGIDSSHTP